MGSGRERSRIPKKVGLESIQGIIDRWLRKNQVRARLAPDSVYQKWKEVVGDEVAQRTRVVDVTGGVLVIEVDSGPLIHELSTYYKNEILESLRALEEMPNLRDIRFRAGTFENNR